MQRETNREAETAAKEFEALRDAFNKVAVQDPDSVHELAEICAIDQSLSTEVRRFLQNAIERLTTAKNNCADEYWTEPAPLHVSCGDKLRGVADNLDKNADEADSTLQPEVEAKLRSELAELMDHDLLISVKTEVLQEISKFAIRQRGRAGSGEILAAASDASY